MKLAFVIRPSRVWISSISASPRPCAVPPSIWPCTACGLTALPTSCAVPIQTTRVRPSSTSTSATTRIAAHANATCARSPVTWPVSGSSGVRARVAVDALDVDLARRRAAPAPRAPARQASRTAPAAIQVMREAEDEPAEPTVGGCVRGAARRLAARELGARDLQRSRRSRPARPRRRRSAPRRRRRPRAGGRARRRSRRSPPSSRCS